MPITVPIGHGLFAHELRLQGDSESMYITGALEMGDTSEESVSGIATVLHNAARQLVIGACVGTTSAVSTTLKVKLAEPDTYRIGVAVGVNSGGLSGVGLPNNTAYLVKKLTGLGGKTNQGRFFLPGVPASIVDAAGKIPQENLNGVQGVVNAYFNAVNAPVNVIRFVLLHGTRATAVPGGPPTTVNGLALQNQVATQRQRMRR